MTTSMNAQSIMSTFGSFDWLNDDGLGLYDDPISTQFMVPSKRAKTSVSRMPPKLSLSVPLSASTNISTPKNSIPAREKVPTSGAVTKSRYPTHRRRGRKGKSIYRGVCVTREGKWRAVIYKERKQLYLGVFESEIDAAKAHDKAARQHFGDQAMVNFLEPQEAESMQHIPPSPQPFVGGNISPMNGTSKMAKPSVPVHVVKHELCSLPPISHLNLGIHNIMPEFSFPFNEDLFQDDPSCMMTCDLGSVNDIPILENANELFDKSLPFLTGPIDFGELCFI